MIKNHSCKRIDLKPFLTGAWILVFFGFVLPITAGSPQTIRDLTSEEISGSLNSEFQLTSQEQFVLQPVIHEIIIYNMARNDIMRQRRLYKDSLEQKLSLLQQNKSRIREQAWLSIHEENTFQEGLIKQLKYSAPGLIYDPDAVEKSAFIRPWGWVKLKDRADEEQEVNRQNFERVDQLEKGVCNVYFSWPELKGVIPNGRLDEFYQAAEKKLRELEGNQALDAFGIFYPNLEWIHRKKIQDYIRVARERLVKMRDQIRNGTLRMRSEQANLQDRVFLVQPSRSTTDDLYGWVTKEQIREKIALLEKRQAAIGEQYKTKTLRINRQHAGWFNHSEMIASIEAIRAKVGEVNKQIETGDYNVYFPAFKKWFTRNGLDKEISKISERIQQIRTDKNYHIPVDEVSWEANKEMIWKALKRKGITNKQKAYFQTKLGHLEETRKLELTYYELLQRNLQNAHYRFFTHGSLSSFSGGDADRKGLWSYNLTSAMPFYSFQQWDYKQRYHFEFELNHEKRHYDFYYKLKVDYLKKCLDQ